MKYSISINTISLDGKIPQGDSIWTQFNDSFVNRELEPFELANAIFLGHAYAACHSGRRKAENFVKAQHIGLDFDSGERNSSIDYLLQNEFVYSFASILHTTPSHTSASPRSRAIFLLDETVTNPNAYVEMVKFLISLFGSDESCKDPSRFFYGSRDCEIAMIGHMLPVNTLRELYKREGRPAVKRQAAAPVLKSAPIAHTRTNASEIERALSHIPSHMGPGTYDKWLNVLMAVHSELGDDGAALCEHYVPGEPNEVRRKFNSFNGHGIKIGTLFSIAKEYGYKPQFTH